VFQFDSYNPIEDKYYVNSADNIFGVFDGHGGVACSQYVATNLPTVLLQQLKSKSPIPKAFKDAFLQVDKEFLATYANSLKGQAVGSCGSVILFRDGKIHLANVGDSRVVVGKRVDGKVRPVRISKDHNTKNPAEVERLMKTLKDPNPIRGTPTGNTPGSRVGGVVNVTRAFGDGLFKIPSMTLPVFKDYLPYLSAEPEVTEYVISPEDEFIVMSSDGLYEQLQEYEVTGWIGRFLDANRDRPLNLEKAAEFVIENMLQVLADLMGQSLAYVKAMPNKKKSFDDTTVIIIFLDQPKPFPKKEEPKAKKEEREDKEETVEDEQAESSGADAETVAGEVLDQNQNSDSDPLQEQLDS